MVDISSLPSLCFYKIIEQLPIDDQLNIQVVFQDDFPDVFMMLDNDRKLLRSLGIDQISSLSDKQIIFKKLIKHYPDILEPWYCSNACHISSHSFSNNMKIYQLCPHCDKSIFICILSKCISIESLDLRGIVLSLEMLNAIFNCRNISCLKLDFVKFADDSSMSFFATKICPKLKHLSLNNWYQGDFLGCCLNNCCSIDQIHMTIFSTKNLYANCFRILENLEFISLYFFSISERFLKNRRKNCYSQSNVTEPSHLISILTSCKNLRYLKIKSNHATRTNKYIMDMARNFTEIKALNLNFMYFCADKNYLFESSWPELKSLTIDFYDLVFSNDLLVELIKGHDLQRLRILSMSLRSESVNALRIYCENLEHLELVDVKIKELSKVMKFLLMLKRLQELRFEFTVKENHLGYKGDGLTNLRRSYEFPIEKIDRFENFISQHSSLKSIALINWPGLCIENLFKSRMIAAVKNIDFHFKQYD
ncbi:hypothetical protein SSS_05869 [Sarcoptes scabiei]|uniref:F-box domain-containing protein n=1 Tax=Sarcoptes scabiei TaxID=52283 RepID=A0A834R0G8_SARSC|nr:hypothetical protein SSS_05869 [Sarcoptes scabiei]